MVRTITLTQPFLPCQNQLGEGESVFSVHSSPNADPPAALFEFSFLTTLTHIIMSVTGCLWDVESQLLYWLDIKRGQIHVYVGFLLQASERSKPSCLMPLRERSDHQGVSCERSEDKHRAGG